MSLDPSDVSSAAASASQTPWPKWITGACAAAGFAVGAWAVLWPAPYNAMLVGLCCVMVLSVGLTVISAGQVTLVYDSSAPRPTSYPGILLPAAALVYRTVKDVDMIDLFPPIFSALAVGAALVLAAQTAKAASEEHKRNASILGVICACILGAGIVQADRVFDSSAGTISQSTVAGKHHTGIRNPTYELDLDPPPTSTTPQTIRVPQFFYNSIHDGDLICAVTHPGALRLEWREIVLCDKRGHPLSGVGSRSHVPY